MFCSLKHLIVGCVFATAIAGIEATGGEVSGFIEGHLKIISPKEVELAEGDGSKTVEAETYALYPLLILSRQEKKEIAQVTPDANGNYGVALPPGDYVLDVQGGARKRVRAKPQPFTVVSNQTVRVDMDIDTGVR